MENFQKKTESEAELLAAVRMGCKASFEKIYRLYKSKVYWNIRRQINDPAIAEELMQDVFIKIWEKKTGLDLEKPFGAYLFRIGKSRVIDFCRKAKRDKAVMDSLQMIATEISDEPMESNLSQDEGDFLRQAIDLLSPQRKKIFMLCKLEGKSYEEVSKLIGISTSTISDHIVKATKILKSQRIKTDSTSCILFVPILFTSVKGVLEKII